MVNKRTEILEHLKDKKGHILGLTIGSGLFYICAELNQVDLVFATGASRFSQMGLSSLAGSMPFSSANNSVFEFSTREILSQKPSIPIIFSLYAADPTIDIRAYIQKIKRAGFSGICNLPTLSVIGGQFGIELEKAGFSFDKEVVAIAAARQENLLTVGIIRSTAQARKMLDAGCDILCIHCGLMKDGSLQTSQMTTFLDTTTEMVNEIVRVCDTVRPDVIKMLYGGPIKIPNFANSLLKRTSMDGIVGSYVYENILKTNIQNSAIRDVFFAKEEDIHRPKKNDYVDYLIKYIELHYMDDVSIGTLATQLYISRPYLSLQFKKETGQTFSDYLINYRLNKAMVLLKETDLSIGAIAEQVGYPDRMNFSKLFKKKVGISPNAYRK